MKNKKLNKWHLLNVLFIALIFSSCQWVTIEPVEIQLPDEPVKFSVDIQSVFTNKCIACHASTSPILTEGNAYNNLVNGGFIDTENPASSEIYLQTTSGHPGGSSSFSATENALLLKWIEEGAQNN